MFRCSDCGADFEESEGATDMHLITLPDGAKCMQVGGDGPGDDYCKACLMKNLMAMGSLQ
jgi:hypothetical protein